MYDSRDRWQFPIGRNVEWSYPENYLPFLRFLRTLIGLSLDPRPVHLHIILKTCYLMINDFSMTILNGNIKYLQRSTTL